jgi:ubiquitin C-terminal hydrolase
MDKFQRRIIGVQNDNTNSCYLNSVIQILLCIEPLNRFILKTNSFSNKIHGKFIKNYKEIISLLSISSDTLEIDTENIINSDILKETLSEIKVIYSYGQQDAHETFIDILNIMHEGFKNFDNITTVEESPLIFEIPMDKLRFYSQKCWYDNIRKNNYSIINGLFNGQLRFKITCQVCLTEFNHFECFNHLTVPLSYNYSTCIYKCIDDFLSSEHMKDNEKYDCSRCCCKVDAIKITSIWKFPRYLIIHLNRFFVDTEKQFLKNSSKVVYPIHDLTLKSEQDNNKTVYCLLGVIEHHGLSISHGHYTSYIHTHEQFICLDDENITQNCEVPDEPYILIYESVF